MTLRAEADHPGRLDLVARAKTTISAGSASFRFASRLFDRQTCARSWLLYSWCRACDDLADGQTLGHDAVAPQDPAERLGLIQRMTDRALAGEVTGEAPFDALALVARECRIPRRLIDDHIEGFALDAAGWRPATEADLLRYCYHVAGAVGCMMALVMGVAPDDQDTLDRAADLGIAFQLANIARDVVDDARVGRVYLPRTWLAEEGIDPSRLADPEERDALARIAARLGVLERRYRASARAGVPRLRFRSRWAVLAAAGIYGGIADKVVALGRDAWNSRVSTSKAEKLRHVLAGLGGAARLRP